MKRTNFPQIKKKTVPELTKNSGTDLLIILRVILRSYCCKLFRRIIISTRHRITIPAIRDSTALLVKPATRKLQKDTAATVRA